MGTLARLVGIGVLAISFWVPGRAGDEGSASTAPDAAAFEAAKKYHEEFGGQALVVMRDGKILFEAYANGGGPEQRQMLASGSKSFVGVAAAAAVEEGLLLLDDLASDAIEEWKDDPTKSKITYRHLLTLTSGLTAGERGAAVTGPAWKDIISKPMVSEPGEKFEYGAYHLNAFTFALQRKLKDETFEAYLKRRVLDPLGIAVEWRFRCADGHPQVGGGAFMTARDWATFGEFMRLGGMWKGKQVVASDRLAECLKGTKQNPAYGLTWWLREPVPEEIMRAVPILGRDMGDIVSSDWLPDDMFLAAGAGKQRLFIIPSMRLVVVRMGDLRKGMRFRDAEFLDRLLRGQGETKETEVTRANEGFAGGGDREELRTRLMENRARRVGGEGEAGRLSDAVHSGEGPHKVKEIEFAIPAARWQQEMAIRVYFPEDGGPYPLVVFCAGTGGGNDTFPGTSIFLASHGYVVLHTSYPFGARGDGGNAGLTRSRVADVRLALDAIARLPAKRKELDGKIDAARVGAAGHSSGAYIAQLLGGATVVFDGTPTSLRDDRIKAVIQYSGQGSDQQGLTKDSWKGMTVPMLTLTGTRDRGATGGDHNWKKEPFDLSPPGNKHHACYDGGHHGSFSGRFAIDARGKAIFEHAQRLCLTFCDAYLKGDPKALGAMKSDEPAHWGEAEVSLFRR